MRWRLKIHEQEPIEVSLLDIQDDQYKFKVGNEVVILNHAEVFPYSLKTDEVRLSFEVWTERKWRVVDGSDTHTIEPLSWNSASAQVQGEIRSQMPGRILKILVKAGDRISANQPLIVMEAMKMENEIRGSGTAIVKSISVEAGQSVESGALLLELNAEN